MTDTVSVTREELIEAIMAETTDEIIADGTAVLGKPNVLVQGCKYIRRSEPAGSQGYARPYEAALKFAGFIADRVLTILAAAPKAEPVSETVRLSLETANYLERIAEEADDNQWQDWAATMRQASGQMRLLCSAQPEAPKVEQEPCDSHKALGFHYDPCCPHCPADPEADWNARSHPAPASDELLSELHLLEEVCARYTDDEDAYLRDEGEPFGTISTECGLKARAARKRYLEREAKHKGPQS